MTEDVERRGQQHHNSSEERYAACLQCTQHCHRTHGQGFVFAQTPSFYTVVEDIPPSLSTPFCMRIPPAFLGESNFGFELTMAAGKPLHTKVQLEGPSGQVWPVSIQGWRIDDLAFTEGWGKFVWDHALMAGDFLIFKLVSKGNFSVSMYGKDGCEKADALTVQNSGARMVTNAQVLNKRNATDKLDEYLDIAVEPKRRKVEGNASIKPVIIDLDDDDDDVMSLPGYESRNPVLQSVAKYNEDIDQKRIVERIAQCVALQKASSNCRFKAEQVKDCLMGVKEDAKGHHIPAEQLAIQCSADKCKPTMEEKAGADGHSKPCATNSNDDNEKSIMEAFINGHCSPEKQSATKCSDDERDSSEEEETEKAHHVNNQQQSVGFVGKFHSDLTNIDTSSQRYEKQADISDSTNCTKETHWHNHLAACIAKDYITEAFVSKRRLVSDAEREKALAAAKHFKSSRPHMRKLMKESHVYRGFWLSFPSDFSSKYLPNEIQQVTLLDSSGKSWSTKWLGSRNGLSGGWRKFSLDHGLEEGDVCVFELIDRKKLVINVHIFRVVELRNGLPGRDHYHRKPQSRPLENIASRSNKYFEPTRSKMSLIPVKKMRGAILCKKAGYVYCPNQSSKLEQNQCKDSGETNGTPEKLGLTTLQNMGGQAEKLRYGIGTDSTPSKMDTAKGTQTPEKLELTTLQADLVMRGQPKKLKPRDGTPIDFTQTKGGVHRELSVNLEDIWTYKEGHGPDVENSLPIDLDGGDAGSGNAVARCDGAEEHPCLPTPTKTREPMQGSFRKKHVKMDVTRQLDTTAFSGGGGGDEGSHVPHGQAEILFPALRLVNTTLKEVTAQQQHVVATDDSAASACKRYYTRRKGTTEEEFLVELEIKEAVISSSKIVKQEAAGALWVPLSHFTKDKISCHL